MLKDKAIFLTYFSPQVQFATRSLYPTSFLSFHPSHPLTSPQLPAFSPEVMACLLTVNHTVQPLPFPTSSL